jgi:death-on-curing protein
VVRDWNLLESALNRPRAAAYYEGADLVGQAATLLWGLIENHPFYDGNKRTAWVTAEAFLNTNGHELTASDDEAFDLVIAVTQGMRVDEVEAWLRVRTLPIS